MNILLTGGPGSGKTCHAITKALAQSKPVYTNIVDNTRSKEFLPDTFLQIPNDDWTLITESAFIIYDACEHIPEFCSNTRKEDHRILKLLEDLKLQHDFIFIFQHEKFAHTAIRHVSEIMRIEYPFNGIRTFK